MKKFFAFILFVSLCTHLSSCEAKSTIEVKYVIDGDTIILDDNRRVRLIGIDAPEIRDEYDRNERSSIRTGIPIENVIKYARLAREHLIGLTKGEVIDLEFDPGNAKIGHKDKYGRILAYVVRKRDGVMLNRELIKEGYAFAYSRFPGIHIKDFVEEEKKARKNQQGMWYI